MEYANFGSLRDLMNNQTLQLKDILHISIQICSGMFHTHNHPHSLIHRDLKPANIFCLKLRCRKI
jgi:serine/threonine protein kinase